MCSLQQHLASSTAALEQQQLAPDSQEEGAAQEFVTDDELDLDSEEEAAVVAPGDCAPVDKTTAGVPWSPGPPQWYSQREPLKVLSSYVVPPGSSSPIALYAQQGGSVQHLDNGVIVFTPWGQRPAEPLAPPQSWQEEEGSCCPAQMKWLLCSNQLKDSSSLS